jgi:hypothetical protein
MKTLSVWSPYPVSKTALVRFDLETKDPVYIVDLIGDHLPGIWFWYYFLAVLRLPDYQTKENAIREADLDARCSGWALEEEVPITSRFERADII